MTSAAITQPYGLPVLRRFRRRRPRRCRKELQTFRIAARHARWPEIMPVPFVKWI
jgi:hypothetical protein